MSDADPENPPLGETLSSRRGFDGAWVHVRVDEVRLAHRARDDPGDRRAPRIGGDRGCHQ